MNTSKQVNVMIGLLFVTFVVTVGYLFNEANRQEVESAEIHERNAERGARLFVQNCRNCHGLDGTGRDAEGRGTVGVALNAPHFLILGEDNVYGVEATSASEAEVIRTYLRETITCGRAGTFMPKWDIDFGGSLSATQVEQLVTLISGDPTGEHDYWELVLEEGEHADEEQFGAVLEQRFALTAALTEQYGREPTAEEVDAYRQQLTPEQFVGVVERYRRHPTAAEIHAESEAVTITRDATSITNTTDNCGQFSTDTKLVRRTRGDPRMPTPTPTPPRNGEATEATPVVPTPEEGRRLVDALGCLSCHTIDGSKLLAPTWQGLFGKTEQLEDGSTVVVDEAYVHESILMPQAKIVAGYPDVVMPATFGSLNEFQLESIVLYLKTLAE